MTSSGEPTTGAQGTEGGAEDRLTQHESDEGGHDWDVEATDPRPTGAGAGETPEEGRGGHGTTRSNISPENPAASGTEKAPADPGGADRA